jgi:NAD(P)H-dependent flavin oxidoreductase YrpB (nitropropane dioxygenase family)
MTSPRQSTPLPLIIQGGMGAGVSGWELARAVSVRSQLGVVSGTAIDTILVRRLQDGDPGGHVRRAMAQFPLAAVACDAIDRYYLPDGRPAGRPYALLPMYKQRVSVARHQITMLAAFVEVWLAKEGHAHPVGINLLTKLQLPNLATLYGAMLAGVDYVLMGAGIPREIPGALDRLAQHEPASLRLDVAGLASGEAEEMIFDPRVHLPLPMAALTRPRFLAIISAHSLATTLARKSNGQVDGFIVEGATAGGHNAPPRGALTLNALGEPIYGERDIVDLGAMRELGVPFWLAGGTGSPQALAGAREVGAAGIQVGTLFAYCKESGVTPALRDSILDAVRTGRAHIFTDPRASPTGYPFKLVRIEGNAIEASGRERICDLGYLRTLYKTESGTVGYRCPSEPVDSYVGKGGETGDTVGRLCLCNGLMANIGFPQERDGSVEQPLTTSGDDLVSLGGFLGDRRQYTASDVLGYLLQELAMPLAAAS